jgi:hypothetical protein
MIPSKRDDPLSIRASASYYCSFAEIQFLSRNGQKLQMYDLENRQFHHRDARRACGTRDLYKGTQRDDPMLVEKLFSALESRAKLVLDKIIRAAAQDKTGSVDLFEREVHVLYKFFFLCDIRSKWLRDEFLNPNRENNFVFQRYLRNKTRGASDNLDRPELIWLGRLRYILETEHADLLKAAEQENALPDVQTYQHYATRHQLQIWKAAEGEEFLLNDRFLDFEGDTSCRLGCNEKTLELIHMISEDRIHVWLPISPEVAVVFCNPARCWDSPFFSSMRQCGLPWPDNSRLKKAPHNDTITIDVPAEQKRQKMWPATTKSRIHIGRLSPEHQRILNYYSLAHARDFVVFRNRTSLENARRELPVLSKERIEEWERTGQRWDQPTPAAAQRRHHPGRGDEALPEPEMEKFLERGVDDFGGMMAEIQKGQPLKRSKKTSFRAWRTVRVLSAMARDMGQQSDYMKPPGTEALITLLKQAYPPKSPEHQDLISIDFSEFVDVALSEVNFVALTFNIDQKLDQLVRSDDFHAAWEAAGTEAGRHPRLSLRDEPPDAAVQGLETRKGTVDEEGMTQNEAFRSMHRAATGLDILMWLYEERQDILATFLLPIMVPAASQEANLIRIRIHNRE